MKLFNSILFPVFIILLFASCASQIPPPTPDQTVAQFILALTQRDIKSAREFCTPGFISTELGTLDLATVGMSWVPDEKKPTLETIQKNLDYSESEDSARVWYKNQDILVLVLVKENNYWKVDRFGTNFGADDLIKLIPLIAGLTG